MTSLSYDHTSPIGSNMVAGSKPQSSAQLEERLTPSGYRSLPKDKHKFTLWKRKFLAIGEVRGFKQDLEQTRTPQRPLPTHNNNEALIHKFRQEGEQIKRELAACYLALCEVSEENYDYLISRYDHDKIDEFWEAIQEEFEQTKDISQETVLEDRFYSTKLIDTGDFIKDVKTTISTINYNADATYSCWRHAHPDRGEGGSWAGIAQDWSPTCSTGLWCWHLRWRGGYHPR